MNKLEGLKVKNKEIPKMSQLRVFTYYDAPIFSELKTKNGDLYVSNWCDFDDDCNRWLIAKSNKEDIDKVAEGKISLNSFFFNCLVFPDVFMVDVYFDGSKDKSVRLESLDAYTRCFPKEGVFLS